MMRGKYSEALEGADEELAPPMGEPDGDEGEMTVDQRMAELERCVAGLRSAIGGGGGGRMDRDDEMMGKGGY